MNNFIINRSGGKFYFIPHYMPCMSWSPSKGQKVYKWLWFFFCKERR